jgi:hypothetical protein
VQQEGVRGGLRGGDPLALRPLSPLNPALHEASRTLCSGGLPITHPGFPSFPIDFTHANKFSGCCARGARPARPSGWSNPRSTSACSVVKRS